jgi:putative PEP-CTERM system TPR-repeat lipoprotein
MNPYLHRLIVLLLGAVLMACSGERSSEKHLSSEDHLNKARTFLEQSNPPSAIAELKNALKKDVDNVPASLLLGELYFKAGAYEDAEHALSRALTAGAETTAVMPMLAKVLLSLGDYERLDTLTIAGLDPESRSVVQAAKGLAMIYRKNLVVAAEIMDAALQNQPHSAYAQVVAARLSMANGKLDEARDRLTEVVAGSPEYAVAWKLLGDIESAQMQPEKAEMAYTKVINFSGNSFEALSNRAMMRIYQGNYQGAAQDLVLLGKVFGPSKYHPGLQFAWGLVYLENKQFDAAKRAFYQVSEYSDNYPLTKYFLAIIDLEQGYALKALSYAYQFLGLVPDSVIGAKLAAKLELGQKGYSKAEKLLLPVVAKRPDDLEALSLLASAMLAQGKSGEGVELLARLAELESGLAVRARLGAGLIEADSEELGVRALRDVLEKNPGFEQADILIVLNYLHQKNVPEAIRAAQEYLVRNPSSATSYDLLGRAYIASEDRQNAEVAFNKALELRPGDPGACTSLANFALLDSDFEAARNYYKQILEHNPDHMEARLRIAASYAVEGKGQEMLDNLQATSAAYPRALEPRLVMARYYIGMGQLGEVMPLFEHLTEEQLEHPDTLETLAAYELAVSRYNQALVTLEKLLKARPGVSQHHYMKSRAYAGLGDVAQVAAELVRAVELDPQHFYARIALARLALQSDQIDTFEKSLAALREVAPGNLDVMKLEVASAQKRGEDKAALKLLEAVFAKEPTMDNVIALATQREALGDANGAIVQLQRWLEGHADDILVRETLAEIYSKGNRASDVVYQYREILKIDPDNVMVLNNLAWHLLDDDPEQALDYAEKANALYPDSASILDTLAVAHLRNSNIVEARRAIDRARALIPASLAFRYHEAQIRVVEGDTTGAVEVLETLLAQREKFPERAEAEALLRRLK